jgi:hypothetical protein
VEVLALRELRRRAQRQATARTDETRVASRSCRPLENFTTFPKALRRCTRRYSSQREDFHPMSSRVPPAGFCSAKTATASWPDHAT